MKKILIMMMLLLMGWISQAQSIQGKIVDAETSESIPFANITLYNASGDKIIGGTMSDLDGSFKLKAKKGSYQLKVSVLAYTDYHKTNLVVDGKVDLGTLELASSDLKLQEVEVRAERSYIENRPGKQILNVGKDIASRGGNVTAIIKALPSVEVTPKGDISIRGNSQIKILINGKQPPYGIDAKTLLKQFPASSIERIEVITNATAKDDPESAGGAINIITKKNKMDGLNLAAHLEAGMKPFRANGGLTMNYSKKKINTYLTYAYYQEKYLFDNDDETKYSLSESLIKSLTNSGKGDYADKGHLLLGGMDYELDSNHTLNLELMYNNYKNDWGYSSNNQYKAIDGSINKTNTTNRSKDKINFTDVSLNYTFNNKKDQKLDIKSHLTNGGIDSRRTIEEIDEMQEAQLSKVAEKGLFTTLELSLDYAQPLGKKSSIETGLFNDGILFDASQDVEQGTFAATKYNFRQRRHAIYGTYEYDWGLLSTSVGVRGEYYQSLTKEANKTLSDQKYYSLFPNLKLQYDLSESGYYQTLNLSYARSLRRPDDEELDPNIDYSNPFHLEKGNPKLKPEFIDKLELSHNYSKGKIRVNTTLFATLINDVIQQYSELQGNGVVMSSYINYSQKKSIGLELNSTLKPFDWWHLSPAGMVVFSRFAEPKDKDAPYNKDGSRWNVSINNTFKFKEKHTIQAQAYYYGKNVHAYYTRNSYAQVNLAYEYSLWGGIAAISASITDVFNGGGRESYHTIGKDFKSSTVWNSNNRFFKLGFRMFLK